LWTLWISRRFKQRYRELDTVLKERVSKALEKLEKSDNPRDLGEFKKGPWRGYYAYELGLQCRILYDTLAQERKIRLHRVCTHKEVYGP
jgi:mRNA-degrading endonuclease RelE of RelBE toxin-antitoxin system